MTICALVKYVWRCSKLSHNGHVKDMLTIHVHDRGKLQLQEVITL